jgi:hypothetical protein
VAVLIIVFAFSFFLPTFDQVGHLQNGCYWTDALVILVRCEGFWAHQVAAYILNLPLNLVYVPMFGLAGISEAPWLLPYAALIWTPILYFFWYFSRALKNRTRRAH